ncbi:hypothetical protein BN159_8351 [Streptomyces davaonensis JCM 4913]|uniref:DUF1877 family protein n=1 Tax=Streptomyces davaonensis (strain DSM 101723 / JCM 4913 / KCC S-0913 / 768) TaxID=1214101 RepID=K4RGZ6_STRDJ|nr:hypothetical protein [Streptomyces davaonensis]CCK32729.1 hypothetical protein BN159_8351 [Streptomyces davaonensis JCM 4913]
MGVLHDYFLASDHATAVNQAIGPDGDWLQGTSLEDAGVDWVDAKGLDPNIVLGQLVAHAEGVPFTDLVDEPELVWPEPPYPQGESIGPDSPWSTGLVLQQLPDRWRDVLAELPEDAVAMVAARWQEIEEVDFGDFRIAREAVETFTALARRARAAGAHLYCRTCV